MAELSNFTLRIGDAPPDFRLPTADGQLVSLRDAASAKAIVVVFWCNHCPYVQAWESRMVELGREYGPKGVRFFLINSNDARAYPADAPEAMARRAREHGYPFPYLVDESQAVARAYGALVTPHVFVFDGQRRLVFQGRIDDAHDRPHAVRHRYLKEALEAALAGRPVPTPETSVLGCSVKWRS